MQNIIGGISEADDFHDCFGDGWTTLCILLELESESNHTFEEHKSAFAWMVKILRPDIELDTDLSNCGSIASLLTSVIESGNVEMFRFILDAFENCIESRVTEQGPTLLVECVHHGQYAMGGCLIQRGANLHAEGFDTVCGELWIGPTCRALFSSAAFFEWRKLLREQNVDLDEFIASATKQPLWIRDGWQNDTLRKLFDLDFEPTPQPTLGKCQTSIRPRIALTLSLSFPGSVSSTELY
jgi:hypothetical protein